MTLETLEPRVWRYVLTMDDLASLRLKMRSDVTGGGTLSPPPITISTVR